jgi:hypothetical protein
MDRRTGDEFYVGYLSLPPGYRGFLVRVLGLLAVGFVGLALLVSAQQSSPGTGTWDSEVLRELQGVVYARPYPMLRVAGRDAAAPVTSYLLVREGKFGARGQIEPLDGKAVHLRASQLNRSGRSMLEIGSAPDDIREIDTLHDAVQERLAARWVQPLGRVRLRGEIIDPKCYLGAMKPGGGKTHKACATLCLRGGIPPMFVTRDGRGQERFYLLTDAGGGPVLEAILPYVGEPVELSGELQRDEDLLILRLANDGVRRL